MKNKDDNQAFILCNVGMSFFIKRISSKQYKEYFYRTISPFIHTEFFFVLNETICSKYIFQLREA